MSRPPINSIVGGTRRELCDMPWGEYLDFPALNGSVIVPGQKSMKHLKWAWDKGDEDTDALRFGRLQHCLLLEPREVEIRYRIWTGRRAGNEYTLFCADAEACGAEVVKADGDYSMAAALEAVPGFLAHPKVQALIKSGKAEQTLLAVEQGLQCKGRLDWLSTSEHALTDLKTARDIGDRAFGRAFFNFGYDVKLGLYKRWLDAVTGERWPVQVIVLENHAPHDVAVIPVPDAVLDAGVEKGLRVIEQVAVAIEADEWLGVAGDEFYPLHVPFWVIEEETSDEVLFHDE